MTAFHAHQGDERLRDLPPSAIEKMHTAARAIRDGALPVAQRLLKDVLASHRRHPEAMRLMATLHAQAGRHDEAFKTFELALERHPDDAWLHNDLGNAMAAAGRGAEAFDHWREAARLAPGWVMPWYNLGRNQQLQGDTAAAIDSLRRACESDERWLPAHILLGDALLHAGDFDAAAARYRHALSIEPSCGDAWRGLSNIKTVPLTDADAEAMAAQLARPGIADEDRIAMRYALGKLEEDRGNHDAAFEQLAQANRALNNRRPWRRDAFERQVEANIEATATLPEPADTGLGTEVIFIVGMPRSGSTLFEQILAAHPNIEGASELPDLEAVIEQESACRGKAFPDWIADAGNDDWQRLGADYLARTARWRERHPRFTDKMPENWRFVGVLRAMLPGATIIDARRDPLETAWSCFRQQFYRLPHFASDFDDVGRYLRTCEHAMDRFRDRDPGRIHLHRYEALLDDPEAGIRRLLADCGLTFDEACLRFHEASRSVRTASAAQVRQPLRRDTARAAAYGARLDPLRRALGI
ncbi:MAG: sulfotransferase [Lysobacteraceae bacterium]|nr:sulfotransferase [Xanthomonadales bacterium]MCP5477901.1 sulfotransferase [Rhodanobacteraceae bacterium]HPF73704.1 sulfotransferase [Xanthomonadaceae bacterium]HRY00415.1 sulfotransferase [Xanthomonadaceae bacterium]